MILYTADMLSKVAEAMPENAAILGDEKLLEFLEPFGDTYYVTCGEWKLHKKGIEPTKENVAERIKRRKGHDKERETD